MQISAEAGDFRHGQGQFCVFFKFKPPVNNDLFAKHAIMLYICN